MSQLVKYLSASRHPWPCLLFLVPLLVVYEIGVFSMGGGQPEALRNGADAWLRWALEVFGVPPLYYPPAFIIVVFLAWSLLRFYDRPQSFWRIGLGMTVESVLFAIGLWSLSQYLAPLLDGLGIRLSWAPDTQGLEKIITFVGAGIYEEVLFRLLLISVLWRFFRLLGAPRLVVPILSTLASAVIFAAAHHVGPYGEAFDRYVFIFRTFAGLYFALLYQLRGFGIAVGTHACYDVLVGVLIVQ